MASISISEALSIVHDLRHQEQGLWRLDSPTEAALVAQLCNRQHGEEVVASVASVGGPSTDPEEYCFAHLAPPHVKGSAKARHMYMMGQHPQYCGLQLAVQKGLPVPKRLHGGPQQLVQHCLGAPQDNLQHSALPSSPAAASPQPHAAAAEQACDPAPSCRTPVSQLRAGQALAADSSPCNNTVRRLAADIKAASPALQVTLAELGSFPRRSTASFRSRVSTQESGQGEEEHITPAASPGRAWVAQPAAACELEAHSPILQDDRCPAGGEAPADPAARPEADGTLQAEVLSGQMLTVDSPCSCEWQHDLEPPVVSAHSGNSSPEQAGNELQLQQALAAAVAVPSLKFGGFAASSAGHPLVQTAGSMQLETPRLEPRWAPLSSSNHSSSNGTTASTGECHVADGSAVQDGPGSTEQHSSLQGMPSPAADANDHAQTDADDGTVTAAGVCTAGEAAEGSETAGDAAAGSGVWVRSPAATAEAAGWEVSSTGDAECALTADAADVFTTCNGCLGSPTAQEVLTDGQSPVLSPGSSSGGSRAGDLGSAALVDIVQLERPGSPGFWSCDESDYDEGEQQEEAGPALPAQHTQHTGAAHTLACAAASAAAAAAGAADVGPCQLPLSPLLLKELSKQLSFQEGVAADPPRPADDDATTCCDYCTVYSYEEWE